MKRSKNEDTANPKDEKDKGTKDKDGAKDKEPGKKDKDNNKHGKDTKDKDGKKDTKDSKDTKDKDKNPKDMKDANPKDKKDHPKDKKDKNSKGKKDKTSKKHRTKDNPQAVTMGESVKKAQKLPKGTYAPIVESMIHEYKAVVQLPPVSSYFELIRVLSRTLEIYRSFNRPWTDVYFVEVLAPSGNWIELTPNEFEKMPDKPRIRVQRKANGNHIVHLPEYKRAKNEYIGINLKAAKDLATSILRHCKPYVLMYTISQKNLKFKSLTTKSSTSDPFFGENFVIPIPNSVIKNGKISDTLVVTVFNYQKGSQPSVLGKTKFPLSFLEKEQARPLLAKLDHGGHVDMELRWFEDAKVYASPKDPNGYRSSISSGTVFFTPPPAKSKQVKTEIVWFEQLTPIQHADLKAGDILIQKLYDDVENPYHQIVSAQKKVVLEKGTMRSCHSLLVTKDGGETIGICAPNGIELSSTLLYDNNYLVYRCKLQNYSKEAATWAIQTYTAHPDIKYSATTCIEELKHHKEAQPVDKKFVHKPPEKVPSAMMCSEFVITAYQQNKEKSEINMHAATSSPIKLEDYLNQHTQDFSFVGVLVQLVEKTNPKRKDKRVKKTKAQVERPAQEVAEEEPPAPLPPELTDPPGPNPCPCFGVKLDQLYKIHGEQVPVFWKTLFDFLSDPKFLDTEGILRVPGSAEEATYYKQLFDLGRDVTFRCSCHDAVGLLKMYLRELPDTIIPPIFDQQIPLIVGSYEPDNPEIANEIKFVIASLPEPNKIFFSMLMDLLNKIVNSPLNKMTVENVIRCIVPTLKCGPQIVLFGLNYYPFIFGGAEHPNAVPKEPPPSEVTKPVNNVRRPPAWAVREKKDPAAAVQTPDKAILTSDLDSDQPSSLRRKKPRNRDTLIFLNDVTTKQQQDEFLNEIESSGSYQTDSDEETGTESSSSESENSESQTESSDC